MSETAPPSPDPKLRKHLDKATSAAAGGDPSYAISVCESILEKTPGWVEARRILRQAQRARLSGGGLQKLFGTLQGRVELAKAAARRRKDPAGAMVLIEKSLSADPDNATAYRLLGAVAIELGLPDTAVFAFEDVCRLKPGDAASFLALGNALSRAGKHADAVRAAERALEIDPSDGDAQALLKDASVAQTMAARDSAVPSQAASAVGIIGHSTVATEGDMSIIERISEAEHAFAGNPEDVRLARQIAGDYARLGKPEEALRWIGRARATPAGAADESLERLEFEYGEATLAKEADEARAAGDSESVAAAQAKLSAFRREGLARLCRRYPGDGDLRLRHGELLLDSGDSGRAAPEFQAALRDARVRAAARFGLGRSFLLTGKPDLAREQLEQARTAHAAMDERGKAIRYTLAEACEALGDREAAANHFKALYAADVGYRDVAERVAKYY